MVKKTEWQRVKLTARKLAQQLVKEKEKVDTTTEVQQSPTRNSAKETTFGTDPTEETTNLRGEKQLMKVEKKMMSYQTIQISRTG